MRQTGSDTRSAAGSFSMSINVMTARMKPRPRSYPPQKEGSVCVRGADIFQVMVVERSSIFRRRLDPGTGREFQISDAGSRM